MASVNKKSLRKFKKILIYEPLFDEIILFVNGYLSLILFLNKLFHVLLLNKGVYASIARFIQTSESKRY